MFLVCDYVHSNLQTHISNFLLHVQHLESMQAIQTNMF